MAQVATRQSIGAEFQEHFTISRECYERAQTLIPGGITHDSRQFRPYPVTVERAEGGHKWAVDGDELIDFAMGHGALILGHGNPIVGRAIREQLELGTHFGAGHDTEVRWADRIRKLIPSAEQVRFTMSGTESTLLALRLARAATGRTKIVKFAGHFHGWNDYMLKGERHLHDDHVSGVPEETLSTVDVLPADITAVRERLAQGDVAAVIIEPSGGSWSMVPLPDDEFLGQLRAATAESGTLLIFDEVITGFRWSPGGAQAKFGVTPDLTTLAKIVAGGMPGGAVAGRLEVMQYLATKDDADWNANRKVRHMGTYNANPVSSAAGVACLDLVSDPEVQAYCDDLAAKIRTGFNQVTRRHGVPGFTWGESSSFHVALGVECDNTEDDIRRPTGIDLSGAKSGGKGGTAITLSQAMLLQGVDLFGGGGLTCVAHTDADVEKTIAAFDVAVSRMTDEGMFDR
ncbi:MAG TPA: aminotransferase class III-fold pyridoxal phosphate-dependent enzyme [Thermomicrobiales bacterium]|jgi:glutamate-1-semialdehyde 2,1-aminomutase|nr:aminotransferase class III-fold pyridoxal phosphate-dependent enzyme [Thermomicrobiales bacterium]